MRFGIKKSYFVFLSNIIIIYVISLIGFFVFSYNSFYERRISELEATTSAITKELDNILAENKEILRFLGRKIINIDESAKKLDKINAILMQTGELSIKSMTQSYVSWANIRGDILVSGKEGILKVNFPTITNRSYYIPALHNPWQLQVAEVKRSLFSDSLVLPTVMSIGNSKNEVIGFLVLGLRVNHILSYLKEQVINNNKFFYIVTDKKCNLILESNTNSLINFVKSNAETLEQKIVMNREGKFEEGNFLFFYKNMNELPFTIFTQYKKITIYKEYLCYARVSLILSVIILFTISMALYFLGKMIIKPIIEISNNAEKLFSGDVVTEFKEYLVQEMNILTKTLKLVFKQVEEIKTQSKKLETLHKKISNSDSARKRFIKSINRVMHEAITCVIQSTNNIIFKVLSYDLSKNDKEEVNIEIKKVQDATMKLQTRVNDSLNLKSCDLRKILNEAITIVDKEAIERNISIKVVYNINIITSIYTDPEKMKIILVGLLFNSVKNSPKNSNIKLSIKNLNKNNNTYLQLTILDSSFVLDHTELNYIEESIGISDNLQITEDLLDLKPSTIESIVTQTEGEIHSFRSNNNTRQVILKMPLIIKNNNFTSESSELKYANVYKFSKNRKDIKTTLE
jgi:signal transduction histidine kinase